MKPFRLVPLLCLLPLLSARLVLPPRASAQDDAPPEAAAPAEVGMDYFYDALKPFGEWVQVADYGLCWHPLNVGDDWAPYTDGYWAYTDAGWTWVSYEDFGGIVYHYGRWVRVEAEGWFWVPDHEWGPAWVSWRNNEDVVGWAPLPPEAHFRRDVGISVWTDDAYDIGPAYYRFCRVRDFGAPVISEVCLPPAENVTYLGETVNITNITYNEGYGSVFNGGPRYDVISLRAARPIPALRLVRNFDPAFGAGAGGRRSFAAVQRGNTLVMPTVRVRANTNPQAAFTNATPSRVFGGDRVTRGWDSVQTPAQREQLRQTVRDQAKGATPANFSAKPVNTADLQVIPRKADPNAVLPGTAGGRNGARSGQGISANASNRGSANGAGAAPLTALPPVVPGAANVPASGAATSGLQGNSARGGKSGKGKNSPQIIPGVATTPVAPVAPAGPGSAPHGYEPYTPPGRGSNAGRSSNVAPSGISQPAGNVPGAPAPRGAAGSGSDGGFQPPQKTGKGRAAQNTIPSNPAPNAADNAQHALSAQRQADMERQEAAARQQQLDRQRAQGAAQQRAAADQQNAVRQQQSQAQAQAAAVQKQQAAAAMQQRQQAAAMSEGQKQQQAAAAAAAQRQQQAAAAAAAQRQQQAQQAAAAATYQKQQQAGAAAAYQRQQQAAAAAAFQNQQRAAAAATQQRAAQVPHAAPAVPGQPAASPTPDPKKKKKD